MKISLKTGGLYTRLLPEGTVGNTADIDVPDGASPVDVVRQLGADPDGRFLLVLNGKAVPPSERDTITLSASDQLSLMPPLKGG